MSLLIATAGWSSERWAERMRQRFPDRNIQIWPEKTDDLADIDYVLAWKAPAEVLRACPNLKVIFSLGAGVDHLLSDPQMPEVPIVRVVDPDLTERMCEWVVFQVLLHHRQHLQYTAQQAARDWAPLPQPSAREVRVGILGLGVLGARAGQALASLGFQVGGWARGLKAIEGIESFAGADELGAFLERTDILVNLLPLTPETRHLVDHALLSRLARDGALGGPVFINAGRGGSQVEADIARALGDGTLTGASLDVFETEPLPTTSPLWDAPNLVISPHVAADSDPEALSLYIEEQIRTFEAGGGLRNVVDPTAGY